MKTTRSDDMRAEYSRADLGKGVRGKYYRDYCRGAKFVMLSPDVAAAFPDDDSVNSALRALLTLARQSASLSRRQAGRGKVRRCA